MINYKETGEIPQFDFMTSAIGLGGKVRNGLLVDRAISDYTKSNEFILPPNLLRGLLSEESINNLREGFEVVCKKYPGRFDYFNLHLRGLSERRQIVLPWDILTYVQLDKREIYAPVNVSFSHTVMTSKWDEDPEKDYELKRKIVESQLMDITLGGSIGGPSAYVYGVTIPEKHSYGTTNKIFTEYPSYRMFTDPKTDFERERLEYVRKEYGAIAKSVLTLNGDEYKLYLFRGAPVKTRDEFETICNDDAFLDYCNEITLRWNINFTKEMALYNSREENFRKEQEELFEIAKVRLLKQLGAVV